MQTSRLLKKEKSIIRVFETKEEQAFIIDCIKKTMPKWVDISFIADYVECSDDELLDVTNMQLWDYETLDAESRRFIHEHYTWIAGVLPFISDEKQRNKVISQIAFEQNISKQSVRNYLCLYLVYQDMTALAPKRLFIEKQLTKDEKNMRWALNKFFYNKNKNSLKTAYTMMLKEKYCDKSGVLLPEYPTFHQFRYYYEKHRNMQTYYISRNGIKNYQRNNRPLTGDGIQSFAPMVGVGMLDATICDIYLVNDTGSLVGRPILTACIDAYSGLCCGYSLSWEGGVYSLRNLMLNVITDKVEWCEKFGIRIQRKQWDCSKMPGTLVTDMGSEYKSETFEQIAELGVRVVNLPPYRPELKGAVEKFFDLVQDMYKKHLKGKGVIEPDYQERGSHDYRKDARLTMNDFEKVVLRCIIYYNSQRIVDNFPYTDAMVAEKIKPYASNIWNWGNLQMGANLIPVDSKRLILTLLPRTNGKFSRYGLRVNKMRYHCDGYTEQYLKGGSVTVAYNPEDVSCVWLVEKGVYRSFQLIEGRYKEKKLIEVETLKESQKLIVKEAESDNRQAQIDLAKHIEAIANSVCGHADVNIKDIRITRKREQYKNHIDYVKDGVVNG